ncbi:hypothetical protein [Acidisoma sp. 7E03]
MSRHVIPARDPSLSIVVGWDNPLQSFFAQVERAEDPEEDDDDPILLWVGAAPREVITVEDLARHMAPYAGLPADVAEQLRRDRASMLGHTPTAIQQAALAAIRRAR